MDQILSYRLGMKWETQSYSLETSSLIGETETL